jgi:putative MFS transporter
MAGWRWLLALAACGGLVVWLVRRRLPESPRWLAATGDFNEADAVLTTIEHKVYGQTGENAEPHAEEHAPATLSTARPPSSQEYRSRRLLMWLMWTLQPVGFYGFASIVPIVVLAKGFDLTHSLTYAALSALGYPLGSLVSVFLTERVERRAMLIASTIAAAVFGVSFGLAGTPTLIIAFGIATTISTVIQSNIIHTYQAELFHTANRSSAIGLPYAASRFVSALLPLAALPLLAAAGPTGLYACCALLLIAMAVAVRILGPRIQKQQLDTI